MTPEERAKQIAWDEFDREDDTTTSLENLISEAIKHFIQEEREACAKLAFTIRNDYQFKSDHQSADTCLNVGLAIRNRK
jgi:hypothetical protein